MIKSCREISVSVYNSVFYQSPTSTQHALQAQYSFSKAVMKNLHVWEIYGEMYETVMIQKQPKFFFKRNKQAMRKF